MPDKRLIRRAISVDDRKQHIFDMQRNRGCSIDSDLCFSNSAE